jgi:flagellar assembly protein FliH
VTVLQLLPAGGWPTHADGAVLAPEDLCAVRQAQDLARQCEQHCAALVAQAHAQAEAQVAAGLQRGLDAAAARCAAQLLAYEQAHDAQWARLEQETAAMVQMVLDRVAPSLSAGELVRALVRQAVSEARQARRLIVKVHPDLVANVEQELGPLRASCAWLESLEVVGVPELLADDCVLESPNGYINAGWATQRAAIRQALDGMTPARGDG